MTEPNLNAARRPALRRLLLGAAFAATFAAGGIVVSSAPALAQAAMDHAGMGHMGHGGDMHAQMMGHLDHMLAAADASPEQKEKIHGILKSAMEQLKPMHKDLMTTHQELHRILSAPTIDRAALEQLRASRVAEADQASKILVGALADAADVLSPEQRAKLAAAMEKHHAEHGAHH
jgi:Spy/CpxP family protein refolding chaperone